MGLIIRSSTIHAAGCYTTAPIAKGERVVEYTGPLIAKEEGDLRYEDRPITYLFGIGDGTRVIDGHGTAMFINHSCDANCETEEIDGHVWIMAIRDIAAGEELCYDYCLYDGDEEEAPCNCGARTCRGSMFSPEELLRRKRLARKTAAKRASVKAKKKLASRKDRSEKTPAQQKRQVKPDKAATNTRSGNTSKRTPPNVQRKGTAGQKKRDIKTSNRKSPKKPPSDPNLDPHGLKILPPDFHAG